MSSRNSYSGGTICGYLNGLRKTRVRWIQSVFHYRAWGDAEVVWDHAVALVLCRFAELSLSGEDWPDLTEDGSMIREAMALANTRRSQLKKFLDRKKGHLYENLLTCLEELVPEARQAYFLTHPMDRSSGAEHPFKRQFGTNLDEQVFRRIFGASYEIIFRRNKDTHGQVRECLKNLARCVSGRS